MLQERLIVYDGRGCAATNLYLTAIPKLLTNEYAKLSLALQHGLAWNTLSSQTPCPLKHKQLITQLQFFTALQQPR